MLTLREGRSKIHAVLNDDRKRIFNQTLEALNSVCITGKNYLFPGKNPIAKTDEESESPGDPCTYIINCFSQFCPREIYYASFHQI